MKGIHCAVAVLSCGVLTVVAWAAPGSTGEGAGLKAEIFHDTGARTRYETTLAGYGGMAFEVRRQAALARVSYGDFFIMGGVTYEAMIEPVAGDYYYPMPLAESASYGYYPSEQPEDPVGDGFVVMAGLRNTIWQKDRYSLEAFGQLNFWSESYDATGTYVAYAAYAAVSEPAIWPPPPDPVSYTETYDIVVQGTELVAGLVGSYIGTRYTLYGGVEVLPYSDVEAAVTITSDDGSSYSETSNSDRSRPVTLLLGLKASFSRAFFTIETRSVGETSLRVGTGVTF